MRTVVNGNMVTVHSTGTLENVRYLIPVLAANRSSFRLDQAISSKGFNDAVIDMEIGDEKTFSLGPDMAYGYRDDELVRSIPRSIAGSQFKPEVGMTIGIQMEDGTKMPTNITQVTDDSITIDMNSPLAGKTLNFKIQGRRYLKCTFLWMGLRK
ncbi:MAG: FKBP-type peptidyl-prolyl cis-trans isomerase [Dissulfurimicrobium sp.]|uniref:FKBP-type peptidyl-prolyl cis-trans isomerase n=1 Tax=Dissulfurimicrobium sp. TaxID=2022436 RepID=UPI00404A5ABC